MRTFPRWTRRCLVLVPATPEDQPFLVERVGKTVRCRPGTEASQVRPGLLVVGCLPVRESLIRLLEAPFSSRRKTRRILVTLLDVNIPFPLDECVHVFLELPGGKRGHPYPMLAVVARLSDLDRRLSSLQKQGFDPVIVDHEGLALWTQSLIEIPDPPTGPESLRVVMHLNGERSCLCLGQGSRLVSVHPVRSADPDDWTRRLRMALDQARLNLSPLAPIMWIWTGPEATKTGLRTAAETCLSRDWPTARWATVSDPAGFLARALGTRVLTAGPLRCNLRIGPREHPRCAVRRQRARNMAGTGLGVAGAILLTLAIRLHSHVRRAEAEAEREVAVLLQRIVPYPVAARGTDAVRVASAEATSRLRRLRVFQAEGPSLRPLLSWVAEAARRSSVRIERLAWDGERGADITVVSPDPAGLDLFVRDLRGAGYGISPPRARSDEGVFEVTASVPP